MTRIADGAGPRGAASALARAADAIDYGAWDHLRAVEDLVGQFGAWAGAASEAFAASQHHRAGQHTLIASNLRATSCILGTLADELDAASASHAELEGEATRAGLIIGADDSVWAGTPGATSASQQTYIRELANALGDAHTKATGAYATAQARLAAIQVSDFRIAAGASGYATTMSAGAGNAGSDANSPLSIATRLANNGLHAINVSPDMIAFARQQAQADGIDPDLMLAILWQEQQWYQGGDIQGLFGQLEQQIGQFFDWTLSQTIDPNKSLGICHMKLATVRMLADYYGISTGGTPLSSLDDASLAKAVEQDQRLDIFLAAKYLQYLKDEQFPGQPASGLFRGSRPWFIGHRRSLA